MIKMASSNKIDLKIVDDPNYQLTEANKGKVVVVFIKGEKDNEGKDSIGHWMLKEENGYLV